MIYTKQKYSNNFFEIGPPEELFPNIYLEINNFIKNLYFPLQNNISPTKT